MGESQSSNTVSTVNTNTFVVASHKISHSEKYNRAVTISGIIETRDLLIMVNRLAEKYESVGGITSVDDDAVIIYCN